MFRKRTTDKPPVEVHTEETVKLVDPANPSNTVVEAVPVLTKETLEGTEQRDVQKRDERPVEGRGAVFAKERRWA